jgi:MFS family permease
LQVLGLIMMVIALPLAFLVDDRSKDAATPASAGPDRHAPPAPRLGAILRQPAFYLLAIGSMCSIAAVGGTNQHLKLFLSLDRAYSQTDAASIISLVLAISIAGRLFMGWLADRMPRKHVMLLIYVLVAAAIPLLLISGSPTSMSLFAVVFGLGLGGEYLIIPLMAGELFGVAVLGRVMGIVLTLDGVAEATAPMLVGYLRDRTGTYNIGFTTLVITALAGAVAIALLPRTMQAPGTLAPSTLAPSTLAPGTLAPGTQAPGTSAPGTQAPGTSAPGTSTQHSAPSTQHP